MVEILEERKQRPLVVPADNFRSESRNSTDRGDESPLCCDGKEATSIG